MVEAISRRERRATELPNIDPRKAVASLKTKKWSELSSSEKDSVMGLLAVEMGFVKAES